MTYEEVTAIVELLKSLGFNEQSRRNALLVGNTAHYGLGRMFQQVTDQNFAITTNVVTSMPEAAGWLQREEKMLVSLLSGKNWTVVDQ